MVQKGSVLGGSLLVAGCSIGAGMLGLPVVSALAGFGPSMLMCVLTWAYMCCTGLLLLEVNLWFKEEVSIVTMAGRTLGNVGKALAWGLFLYLFYSLMVAYIGGSGSLFTDFFEDFFGIMVSKWVGSLFFTALFAGLIYCGTFFVDEFNRALMLGLIVTYALLVFAGSSHVDREYLSYTDWGESGIVLSVMVIMFGFHNLVPSLTTYLDHDVARLRKTIIIGSALPLIIYFVWVGLILGLVPVEDFRLSLKDGEMATHILRHVVGKAWVVDLAQGFAFFAIITSLLSVALSFVDFLADGLHVRKDPKGKVFLLALVLLPPFFFSLFYPNVFVAALQYAGGIGAVTLFGLMPAAMVWVGRYFEKIEGVRVVPGGRVTLLAVIAFSLAVMGLLIVQKV